MLIRKDFFFLSKASYRSLTSNVVKPRSSSFPGLGGTSVPMSSPPEHQDRTMTTALASPAFPEHAQHSTFLLQGLCTYPSPVWHPLPFLITLAHPVPLPLGLYATVTWPVRPPNLQPPPILPTPACFLLSFTCPDLCFMYWFAICFSHYLSAGKAELLPYSRWCPQHRDNTLYITGVQWILAELNKWHDRWMV